jgi:hypothetical protein
MVQIGQTVNGYTIVAIALVREENNECVILGKKGTDHVTAIMSDNSDKEWYWGHYYYFHPFSHVWADFYERVQNYVHRTI